MISILVLSMLKYMIIDKRELIYRQWNIIIYFGRSVSELELEPLYLHLSESAKSRHNFVHAAE